MSKVGRITCFLCGGTHIYPGPRFEAHLINEHGALFDTDFLIQVSLFKTRHSTLPDINPKPKAADAGKVCFTTTEVSIQTEPEEQTNNPVSSKQPTIEVPSAFRNLGVVKDEPFDPEEDEVQAEEEEDEEDEDTFHLNDTKEEEEELPSFQTWACPVCPLVFRKISLIKQHMFIAHEDQTEEYKNVESLEMTEQQFKQTIISQEERGIKKEGLSEQETVSSFAETRKVVGKEWAPNSFSSRFTCAFCGEQFRKDYKLKLHLMMKHKNQPHNLMEKAKEELIKSKLDGCVHKCGMCGNKYNSIANFTRHIKDVHSISRLEYKNEYGSSEILSRMFTCELCQKEVKHTRNIIGAHMKMVHLISWKEYQDIIIKLKNGEETGDLPNPELFDCSICGVSVKYKREHLNKKHQIDEEVYEELIQKRKRGEDISKDLPNREVFTCNICERECLDLKRHLQVCHKLGEEQYREEFLDGTSPQPRVLKQELHDMTGQHSMQTCPAGANTPVKMGNGHQEPTNKDIQPRLEEVLSTDLQCYFNCQEVFKKDYQLFLHLKLRHRTEKAVELEKAYAAANEEIALTRRSASLFNCALCPRVFNDNGAFYGHVQNKHAISYRDYKEKFGRCETESQPFECNICSKVIKYDRNTIHTHLKNVHGINWTKYLDRIRKIRRGIAPSPLPSLKTAECRVCNISVKYLRDHLKNAHKITEKEYEDLFADDASFKKKTREDDVSFLSNNQHKGFVAPAPVEIDLKVLRPSRSDIQNKGNKNCSVCEVEFETRKEFIEHCQVVHGMKFKTAAGVSVPPPSSLAVSVPPPSSAVGVTLPSTKPTKRELQLYQEDAEPADKKFKSFQTSDGFEIEIEGVPCSQELSHNTGQFSSALLSKWNLCLYQCGICSKTSNSKKGLMGHIMTSHGMGSKAYKESFPDIEISREWFLCRICNSSIKFMKDQILAHLKTHGTDLSRYETEYMQEEDWPFHPLHKTVPAEMRSERMKSSEGREEDSYGRASVNSNKSDENQNGASRSTDPWNRCEFQCTLCDAIFIERRQMKAHVQATHKTNFKEYVALYGDPQLTTPKWICQICGAETKHARNNICTHLRECHATSVDQYAADYGVPGGTRGKKENTKERSVGPENQEFWNRCRFQCPICDKEWSEKKLLKQHVNNEHQTSLEQLEQENGDCEVHTEYFSCRICNGEVKHNYKNIMMHLQRSHQLTPAAYQQQFNTKKHSRNVRRSENSNVPCEKCGRKFSSKSNKLRHLRDNCSPPEEPRKTVEGKKCPVSGCGLCFDRTLQLKKHLAQTHKINQNISVALSETDRKAAELKKQMDGVDGVDGGDGEAGLNETDSTSTFLGQEQEDEVDVGAEVTDGHVVKDDVVEPVVEDKSGIDYRVEAEDLAVNISEPVLENKQKVASERTKLGDNSADNKDAEEEEVVPDSTTGEDTNQVGLPEEEINQLHIGLIVNESGDDL